MYSSSIPAGAAGRLLTLLCAMAGLGGCGAADNLPGSARPDSDKPAALGRQGRITYTETEGNDTFDSANLVPPQTERQIVINARIGAADDVDVFDLGPAAALEQLVVEVAADDALRPRVALFDAAGSALMVDDTHNAVDGRGGVFVETVFPREVARAFAAVASEAGAAAVGDYSLVITRSTLPAPSRSTPQSVYLSFDGAARVRIGDRRPVDLGAFEAARIMPSLTGDEATIIDSILADLRRDYAGLRVSFSSSREAPPPRERFATLYVGGYDPALLGVAEAVDEGNSDPGQQAIIFAESFSAFAPLHPSRDQIAQALANVISHEVGHLLGLSHTRDPRAIMDVTAGLGQLLADQSFRRSPLAGDVFPVGQQDSIECLLLAVGRDEAYALRAPDDLLRAILPPMPAARATLEAPARAEHLFCNCFCRRCARRR